MNEVQQTNKRGGVNLLWKEGSLIDCEDDMIILGSSGWRHQRLINTARYLYIYIYIYIYIYLCYCVPAAALRRHTPIDLLCLTKWWDLTQSVTHRNMAQYRGIYRRCRRLATILLPGKHAGLLNTFTFIIGLEVIFFNSASDKDSGGTLTAKDIIINVCTILLPPPWWSDDSRPSSQQTMVCCVSYSFMYKVGVSISRKDRGTTVNGSNRTNVSRMLFRFTLNPNPINWFILVV